MPVSLADLLAAVRARLGSDRHGARCVVSVDPYASGQPYSARWVRVYADGVASDERPEIEGQTVEECLRGIMEYEDICDRLEPQHAGPPPEGP